MSTHHSQDLCTRSGCINGIFRWLQAVEIKATLGIRSKLAAQVVTGLVFRVKNVVFAVCGGLPHVENGIWDSLASVDVANRTVEVGELPIFGEFLNDRGTEIAEGSFGGPEGTED